MAIQTTNAINNPISGVFGTGQIQFFTTSGTWTVPAGIGKVRVRMWGAGGSQNPTSGSYASGGGGGFAMKTIYGFDGISSVAVTVGTCPTASVTALTASGSSSFGSYVSATGGSSGGTAIQNLGGTGVGGDINTTGGTAAFGAATTSSCGGGGAASLLGNGAQGTFSATPAPASTGGAGGGSGANGASIAWNQGTTGGFGNLGAYNPIATIYIQPQSGLTPFSIDFIGTGGGAANGISAANGGGGASSQLSLPGFPGGGNGNNSNNNTFGASGLVIVEW